MADDSMIPGADRRGLTRSLFSDESRRRQVHLLGVVVCVIAALLLVDRLGFHAMVAKYGPAPERLRDFTFPVWQRESWYNHGFLVFLNAGDYQAGVAYSNHSVAYLLAMYVLYQLEQISSSIDMRTSAAFLEMAAALGVVALVIWKRAGSKFHGVDALMPLLGIVYFATEPGYWISAGKFNVDNSIHFFFPMLIVASYQLAYRKERDHWFWGPLLLLSVFAPLTAILLVVFVCVKMLGNAPSRTTLARPSLVMFVVGVLFYLEPVVATKLLGFTSDNSSWLFRSGLDGDRSFFSNPVTAVIHPFLDRPFQLIVVPAILLVSQLLYMWRSDAAQRVFDNRDDSMFVQLLFSQYVLSLILWPQAVSVHPYLYDYLLVGPILVWTILNFASGAKFSRHFTFWSLAMVALITYNLTQIAQAGHCIDCLFPS